MAFGADCLATLDYNSVDDVLFVMHKILTTAARATADIIEVCKREKAVIEQKSALSVLAACARAYMHAQCP